MNIHAGLSWRCNCMAEMLVLHLHIGGKHVIIPGQSMHSSRTAGLDLRGHGPALSVTRTAPFFLVETDIPHEDTCSVKKPGDFLCSRLPGCGFVCSESQPV